MIEGAKVNGDELGVVGDGWCKNCRWFITMGRIIGQIREHLVFMQFFFSRKCSLLSISFTSLSFYGIGFKLMC